METWGCCELQSVDEVADTGLARADGVEEFAAGGFSHGVEGVEGGSGACHGSNICPYRNVSSDPDVISSGRRVDAVARAVYPIIRIHEYMTAAPVLDHLAALADPTRGRLLLALDRHELAVTELASALQLPQSTVSRHLKTLSDAGWVTARNDGASRRYRMAGGLDDAARGIWQLVRDPLGAQPSATVDAERLRTVLEERRSATRAFFSTAASRWDRVRSELFGARVDQSVFLALLDPSLVVGDLGCGTGAVADVIAPFVQHVIAVDDSPAMLGEARRRLDARTNVDVRDGALESLPVADAELDAALVVLALHYAPEPERVLREAVRAVKPGRAYRRRRHAAARPRGVSRRDGPRVARLRPHTSRALADGCWIFYRSFDRSTA